MQEVQEVQEEAVAQFEMAEQAQEVRLQVTRP